MPAAAIPIIGAVIGAAATVYTSEKASSAQKKASAQAQKQAQKQAEQADQDFNKANQKAPNTGALLSANQQAGAAGSSGTMLTGPSGVDPNKLDLGKNTLLGQ